MIDKLEMPLEQFAEAVAKENARLNKRIEKLEAALRKYADDEYNGYNADGAHARKALEGKDD